ncbi:carbohydrate binding family 6 [Fusarium denticulatum]|uniref:Carbohydrate binding family 6 n=1 Tax=Fusarium denticulatum TaxID=48507 RepID=A0A8H5TT32_9HYPO|nr:carbohydrate binding family 6 [Fusarium denticulatum]
MVSIPNKVLSKKGEGAQIELGPDVREMPDEAAGVLAFTSNGTFVIGTNPGGPCNEPYGLASSRACPGTSCAGNFHTHTVEVDGSMHPETEQTIHRPHFILLNLAIGGGFPDGVFGGQTPLETTVSGGSKGWGGKYW